ncbi:MAG TPA: site-2 protease family protein [Chloroflexota bacterium]|nr:site-2 protease family protein [Chloroflexota bacterium]
MTGSFQVGRVLGIPVGVHATWLIVYFLVTWSLAAGFLPATYPGWAPGTYWAVGAAAGLLLFVSVLVHELSHALVARARGLPVKSITLFVFGGVAAIEGEAESPLDEFLVAVVGPLTSAAIAALAWLGARQLGATFPPGGGGVGAAVLTYLAIANGLLAVFNLIPGFPLDGGRVLRAIVWAVSGSLRTATNVSSYVGQLVAFGLIAWGVLGMLGGDVLGGLWTAFIGWFLNGAAESSRQQLAVQETFRGVRVADLMTPGPATVEPDTPLDAFVYEEVIRRGQRALPVVDGGRLLGIVSVTDARKVPTEAWASTPVSAVMTAEELAAVAPGDELNRALKLMADRGLHQALVLDDGRLVGLLTRAAVIQYLALRDQLDLPPRRRAHPVGLVRG